MELSFVIRPEMAHQREWGALLAEGAKRHGHAVTVTSDPQNAIGDAYVCWGWRIGALLRKRGCEVLVMERGYVGDREKWSSLGWNGLNGRATVRWKNPPDADRFNKHFAMAPWKKRPKGYNLIMGQVRGDQALIGVDIMAWYREATETLSRFGAVAFRAHPGDQESPNIPGCRVIPGDLDHALAFARMVVTYNSNSGVDAALAGVPVCAVDDGSMAAPIATRYVGEKPIYPDREEWAAALAWRQFRREEFGNGFAWDIIGEPECL